MLVLQRYVKIIKLFFVKKKFAVIFSFVSLLFGLKKPDFSRSFIVNNFYITRCVSLTPVNARREHDGE